MSNGWVIITSCDNWIFNWIINSWVTVINETNKYDIIDNNVGLFGVILLLI